MELFLKKIVLLYLLLLVSVFSISSESNFELNVLNIQYPVIEIQFVATDSGKPVHFKKVIGSRGQVAINFWFEHDKASSQQLDAVLDVKQLLPNWNDESQSLSLTYTIPNTTSSIGSHVGITLIAQKSKSQRLKWQGTEKILPDANKSAWIPHDIYAKLKQQIQKNQISSRTISQVADGVRDRNLSQQCEIVLQVDLNLSLPSLSQCQIVTNPVTGIPMLDGRCMNLTRQWFDYLVEKNRRLCAIPTALSQDIFPENKQLFNNALLSNLNSGPLADSDVARHDMYWMEQQLKSLAVSDDVIKSFASYQKYSQVLSRQFQNSQKQLDQLIAEKPFRDFLLSELIRSIVTKQFKTRNQFSDWCQVEYESTEVADRCFQYAADISVRFFNIYGFKDLIEFNRSIEAFRAKYTLWSNQRMGTKAGQRSKEYIIDWAVSFSESLVGKSHCATKTLFPFSYLMLSSANSQKKPEFGSYMYPNIIEYEQHIDQLAQEKETFVQEIWQTLGEPDARNNSSPDCVQQLLHDDSFASILSRVEDFPYD